MEKAYDSKHNFEFKLHFYKNVADFHYKLLNILSLFVTVATSTVFATNMTAVKKTIILEAIYVRSVEYRFILVQL